MNAPPARAPHPALAAWLALRASGAERGALVTLVRADGGSSKAVGAHLALAGDGRAFGSVTIGGCADGRALEAARRVHDTRSRELLTLPLAEDDARALGLACAGNVDLLVEPVRTGDGDPTAAAYAAAEDALDAGARAALVTPLDGALGRLLVREDGARHGSVGSPARDDAAAALALDVLHGDADHVVRASGGTEWLVQRLLPARTLLVVGATDVAAALCTLAGPLGWRTIVVDPRDDVLHDARFAAATERHAAMPADVVARNAGAAIVVVAHDYKVELPVLRIALRAGTQYVGMLGSRARTASLRAMLADDGLTAAELDRLRAPIGLAIGAQGAAEIAASIVAELIAVWRSAPIANRSTEARA